MTTKPFLLTMARLAAFCILCINLRPVKDDIVGASAVRKVARSILSLNVIVKTYVISVLRCVIFGQVL
ncbi:hypothetical protein PoMZ_13532 [Pyricularia oryzae]|uniref:Uncharacterized protein n=1 Tax=Pyricularia oryzae TaxID=318829 RepID=A0A4P7NVK9_PYROR|nr:hypothetical protein PoMZ_13532 [Pyricularia oryzae]